MCTLMKQLNSHGYFNISRLPLSLKTSTLLMETRPVFIQLVTTWNWAHSFSRCILQSTTGQNKYNLIAARELLKKVAEENIFHQDGGGTGAAGVTGGILQSRRRPVLICALKIPRSMENWNCTWNMKLLLFQCELIKQLMARN